MIFKFLSALVGMIPGLGPEQARPKTASRRRRDKLKRTPLGVEQLETRLTPAVTGTFSAATGVYSIVGDAANNRIDVEISSGYVTAWNNNAYVQGTYQVALGRVKQINVGAKDGSDTVRVVQKADWLSGNVFIYGDNGNDILTVDVRGDGAAKFTVYGGAGTDTVNVPNWMPVSLATPDETPVLQALARAHRELRNTTTHPEMQRYDDVVTLTPGMIRSSQGSRNNDTYRNAIEQFDVKYGFTNRYGARDGLTFCNFFANDVMTAMGVQLPTYQYTDSAGKVHTKSKSANDIRDWLVATNGGRQAGWTEARRDNATELQNLLNAVRAGKPAIAVYKNSSGPGHIAVIRPDQDSNFVLNANTIGNLLIAQAGSTNFSMGRLSDGFRTIDSQAKVQFFYHE